MATRADAERTADVAKVNRETVEPRVDVETVRPPAPVDQEEAVARADALQETDAAAPEEAVEPRFVLSLNDDADLADGDSLAVAFPGSAELDEADEDGRIVLSRGSAVEISAAAARNADGAYGVEVTAVAD